MVKAPGSGSGARISIATSSDQSSSQRGCFFGFVRVQVGNRSRGSERVSFVSSFNRSEMKVKSLIKTIKGHIERSGRHMA